MSAKRRRCSSTRARMVSPLASASAQHPATTFIRILHIFFRLFTLVALLLRNSEWYRTEYTRLTTALALGPSVCRPDSTLLVSSTASIDRNQECMCNVCFTVKLNLINTSYVTLPSWLCRCLHSENLHKIQDKNSRNVLSHFIWVVRFFPRLKFSLIFLFCDRNSLSFDSAVCELLPTRASRIQSHPSPNRSMTEITPTQWNVSNQIEWRIHENVPTESSRIWLCVGQTDWHICSGNDETFMNITLSRNGLLFRATNGIAWESPWDIFPMPKWHVDTRTFAGVSLDKSHHLRN